MSPPGSLVAAAAIVDDLRRPARLLAARRSAPKKLAGQWEFPGGKVEAGEDVLEALRREIREELGVSLRVGEEILHPQHLAWPIFNGHAMRVWMAEVAEGEPAPLEDHDELAWLDIGDFNSVPWLEPDVPIVAAVESWSRSRSTQTS